jgi:hypothetical protein
MAKSLALIVVGTWLNPLPGWSEPPGDEPSVASGEIDYSDAVSLGVTVTDSPGTGVLVVEVAEQSPADVAGIRADDFILSVDEKDVEKPNQLQKVLRSRGVGEQVSIGLWRGGKTLSVSADLAESARPARQKRPWLGVALSGPGASTRKPGPAVIVEVLPGSPAEKAKLKVGDTVVSLNDQPIKTTAQLVAMIATMKVGETIHLTVNRDGNEVAHEIKLESTAGAPPIFAPFGFGHTSPPVPLLDEKLMPMVPFGHVMRGEDIEGMQRQMDEIRKQLREMQKRLKMRVDSAIEDSAEQGDSSDAIESSDSSARAVRKPRPDQLPQIAAVPVLAAPDERYPSESEDRYASESQDRDRRAQEDRDRRAQAYANRRAQSNRYRYNYYRWPSAGASVYQGFYVPWYTFPSNSPHLYNWPPPRLPYYYQYRGRSFYVRPPYGYGAGVSTQVLPNGNRYYQ